MEKWNFDHKVVGERLRRRRNELHLTIAEVAEQIDKVPKYYADIERGYCGMSIETMLALCHVLFLTPTVLLLGETVPFSRDSDADIIEQICAGLVECTEEQRKNILQTIRLFTRHG